VGVKDSVFVPLLPVDIDDLKQLITNPLATVDREMFSLCGRNSTTVLISVVLKMVHITNIHKYF
jgi:hypothetical protein